MLFFYHCCHSFNFISKRPIGKLILIKWKGHRFSSPLKFGRYLQALTRSFAKALLQFLRSEESKKIGRDRGRDNEEVSKEINSTEVNSSFLSSGRSRTFRCWGGIIGCEERILSSWTHAKCEFRWAWRLRKDSERRWTEGDPWMDAERLDTIVLNDRIISGAMILIPARSNVSFPRDESIIIRLWLYMIRKTFWLNYRMSRRSV